MCISLFSLVNNFVKSNKLKPIFAFNMATKVTPLDRTRKEMREIFLSGVQAVLPRTIIENQLKLVGNTLFVGNQSFLLNGNVYLIGFGKAVMNMVPGIEKVLGSQLKKGIISVPKGSKDTIWQVQDFKNFPYLSGPVEYREGATNNQPDAESLATTDAIMDLVAGLKETDTLIVLISGGGSALFCKPKPPLQLKEKQEFCKKLQQAGADIRELNIVRKKLSVIKGGGLARLAYPASVISLILSDIVGDPVAEIASGPTAYSPKSPDEVMNILKKYGLFDDLDWKMKAAVTSKEDIDNKALFKENEQFKHVSNIIIGNNLIAIEAAKIEALRKGFSAIPLRNDVEGNVSDVSLTYAKVTSLVCMALERSLTKEQFFAAMKENQIMALTAEKIDDIYDVVENVAGRGIILIGGGEPTVVVRGHGIGGRNQQLALQFSLDWLAKVKENPHLAKYDIVMLSGGTDGQDGPNDAAGAFGYPAISPMMYDLRNSLRIQLNQVMAEKINTPNRPAEDELAIKLKVLETLIPENAIENNDAYTFYSRFKNGKDLLKTGLTGTNVMDLHFVCITKRECECRLNFDVDPDCPDVLEEHNLDLDARGIIKSVLSEEIKEEPELLNLKVLDSSLAESCCTKVRRE